MSSSCQLLERLRDIAIRTESDSGKLEDVRALDVNKLNRVSADRAVHLAWLVATTEHVLTAEQQSSLYNNNFDNL